ncbi:MAG: hypothetical protein AAF802_10170 [Planctomycetota bacterium]
MASPQYRNNQATNVCVLFALVASVGLVALNFRSNQTIAEVETAEEQVVDATDLADGQVINPVVHQVRLSEATLRLRERAQAAKQNATQPNWTEDAQTAEDSQPAASDETEQSTFAKSEQSPQNPQANEPSSESEPAGTASDENEPERSTADSQPGTPEQASSGETSSPASDSNPSVAESQSDASTGQAEPVQETPAVTADADVSEESGEQDASDGAEVTETNGLVIYHRDSNSSTITLMVDGSVRQIRVGGKLELEGQGPWSIRFIRGNQYATGPLETAAGQYSIVRTGTAWRLDPTE